MNAETVRVASSWDSGPQVDWSQVGADYHGQPDQHVADIPAWVFERYATASDEYWDAVSTMDDVFELARLNSCGHTAGCVADPSYDDGTRPHVALICTGCPDLPVGHPPWHVVSKATVLAWLETWRTP